MKLYNSYTNQIEEFEPINDNKVNMYVCGPTVYDFAHLGHARCYITWDMVVRYLRFRGYDVTYARNVTDVDDKIIAKANAQNTTPEAIAGQYYEEFTKSMDALNCLKPDLEPMATKTIGDMIGLVKKLEAQGFAYAVDGDVFFRVTKFKDYGKLSNQRIEDLESGARVDADERKESPLDFALWKSAKEGEISWSSPWGKGRPGWHLECSAMINKVFKGETIDIHAGGQDLLFPHHENEIAQSACAFGKQFVKYWMHNGFVTINEEKMSKSLGNFVTINKLLEKYDANTIRFFILTNHYRMPVGFNDEALSSAQNAVKKLHGIVQEVSVLAQKNNIDIELKRKYIKEFLQNKISTGEKETLDKNDSISPSKMEVDAFIEAMDNDFNTSKALSSLFYYLREAKKLINAEKPLYSDNNIDDGSWMIAYLLELSEILGFNFETKIEKQIDYPSIKEKLLTFIKSDEIVSKSFLGETLLAGSGNIPQGDKESFEYALNLLITSRNKAREAKVWEYSDKIRDGLLAIGIVIKDTKEGTTWTIE